MNGFILHHKYKEHKKMCEYIRERAWETKAGVLTEIPKYWNLKYGNPFPSIEYMNNIIKNIHVVTRML